MGRGMGRGLGRGMGRGIEADNPKCVGLIFQLCFMLSLSVSNLVFTLHSRMRTASATAFRLFCVCVCVCGRGREGANMMSFVLFIFFLLGGQLGWKCIGTPFCAQILCVSQAKNFQGVAIRTHTQCGGVVDSSWLA